MNADELLDRILTDAEAARNERREPLGMCIDRAEYQGLARYMAEHGVAIPEEAPTTGEPVHIFRVPIQVLP